MPYPIFSGRGAYATPPPSAVDSFPPWLAYLIFIAFAALAVWLWSITPKKPNTDQH